MPAVLEDKIAERFGLASVVFLDGEVDSPLAVSRVAALSSVEGVLGAVCTALALSEVGLGTCWRVGDDDAWRHQPQQPQLKVAIWSVRRFGEEGNFAPSCGTINLFGGVSSLAHEIGHAIDFQFTGGEVPWSHGEVWLRALSSTPEFCEKLLAKMRQGGRVRLSDMYLASPHEMFARAFECFVVERGGQGGVDGTGGMEGPDCGCPKTYPQGEERKLLCDVIERDLAGKLRERSV